MCYFEPNLPYALISSTLTFWFPMIIMLSVYYKVFKEAMKQKQNMERMNNIRALPVSNNLGKNSFESDKTTHELLGKSSKVFTFHKLSLWLFKTVFSVNIQLFSTHCVQSNPTLVMRSPAPTLAPTNLSLRTPFPPQSWTVWRSLQSKQTQPPSPMDLMITDHEVPATARGGQGRESALKYRQWTRREILFL